MAKKGADRIGAGIKNTIMSYLNELSKRVYEGNKLRGFDAAKENVGQTLMLVVSELAEALEADRKGKFANVKLYEAVDQTGRPSHDAFSFESTIKDTFEDEIADSVIRILDLCGALNIDIDKHIDLKLRYNSTRPFKHGKKY